MQKDVRRIKEFVSPAKRFLEEKIDEETRDSKIQRRGLKEKPDRLDGFGVLEVGVIVGNKTIVQGAGVGRRTQSRECECLYRASEHKKHKRRKKDKNTSCASCTSCVPFPFTWAG